jgi:heat shock protein HtpX
MMTGAKQIQKEDDAQLFNVVDELRIAAGVPMPRIFLVDDSALNAFATGRDPAHGVVAITTGLRGRLNRDELQGVLAHEMAHIRHYDIRFAMLMATMVGLIAFACDAFRRMAFYAGQGNRRNSDSAKGGGAITLVFFLLALVLSIIAPILAVLIQLAVSRQREYLADAGAVELTRNPLGLASALRKLADDTDPLVDSANRATAHLFIVNPLRRMRESGQAINSAFCSHPPVQDRIARLMALAR